MLGRAHAPPAVVGNDQARQDAATPGSYGYNNADGHGHLGAFGAPDLSAPEWEASTGWAPYKGIASSKPCVAEPSASSDARVSMEQEGELHKQRGLHLAKDHGISSATANNAESGSDSDAPCTPSLSTRQLQALLQALMAASLPQQQQSSCSPRNAAWMTPCLSGASAQVPSPQSSQSARTGSQSSTLCDKCRCMLCCEGSSEKSGTCSTLCTDCRNAELAMQGQPPHRSDSGQRHMLKDVSKAGSSPPLQHADVPRALPEDPVSPRQAELLARLRWLRHANRATSVAADEVFAMPLDHGGSQHPSAGGLTEDASGSEEVSNSERQRGVSGDSAVLWEEMKTRTRHSRSLRWEGEGTRGAYAQKVVLEPRHLLHRPRSSMPSAGPPWQHGPAGKGPFALHVVWADCPVATWANYEGWAIAGASLPRSAVKPVGQQSRAQALRGLAESRWEVPLSCVLACGT